MPGSLTWNELQTAISPLHCTFYEKVFGWTWTDGSLPGYKVALLPTKPGDDKASAGAEDMPPNVPEEVPAVWLVYFAVNDVPGRWRTPSPSAARSSCSRDRRTPVSWPESSTRMADVS